MPWPEYPCHACDDEAVHGVKDALGRPVRAMQRQAAARAGDIYSVPYDEADGYYWHTASWNLTTGRWRAVCCAGHMKQGRAA